jgi:N6-L-threonylcarbamoyladenine synthase
MKPMSSTTKLILGIETSCDETAVGIVDSQLRVHANELYSQIPEHAPFGGVVPEIAARTHLQRLPEMLDRAMAVAQCDWSEIGGIAFTRGPGLNGPLLVGAAFARALALDTGLPCYGMNHLEGHIAAAWMSRPDLEMPFVCLTVSGGHTELTLVEPGLKYTCLGATRDDAAGEAFDKSGKLLGLGYPAGALIGRRALHGDRKAFAFPRSRLPGEVTGDIKAQLILPENKYGKTGEFSFSGMKTAVMRTVQQLGPEAVEARMDDLCASVETAIVDILVEKVRWALLATGLKTIVVCGGVSANRYLRERLEELRVKGVCDPLFPDFAYCTDNGAMIAAAAQLHLRYGRLENMTAQAVKPRLPLESLNESLNG